MEHLTHNTRCARCGTRRMPVVRAAACLVSFGLLFTGVAFPQQAGQSEPPAEEVPPPLRERVTQARQELATELSGARAAIEGATAEGRPVDEGLNRTAELLGRLDLVYGQILAALDHDAELTATRERFTADLATLRSTGPSETRPFPFSLLETLGDQIASESSRESTRADAVEVSKASLDEAKTAFEQKERARRKAKEALEGNQDETRTAELASAFERSRLESRVAAEELQLRELEHSNQSLESEVRSLQLAFLKEKIELVAADTQFTQGVLDDYLLQLERAETRLTQALEWAQLDFSRRDAEWAEARRRLEASPTREPDLQEEFAARELARRARQREVALIGEQLQALADNRKAWNRRFRVFNHDADDATVREWATETRQVVDQLDRDLRINTARLTELRKEVTAVESGLQASAESGPQVKHWIEQQVYQLNAMIRSYGETVDQLESARVLHGKLLAEISSQVATVTWNERLRTIWQKVLDIWSYEITSIQDNPITVRKLVIGVILLLVGVFASRRVVAWVARRFLPRLGLNEGAVAAIQSLLFYLLLLTVITISLRIVNVPLTAFTILGGALAIGIGFGSQNIVNNFISGLILLVERPIRVGDLIETEGLIGTVEHIGPRSTRVRGPENMDIIVPNSSFLEKNVVNWTLSDDRYRTHVTVGVIYGSPTRDVVKLIRKALDEHGKVLPKPEPIILFTDFGDDALIFEAHFWVRMRRIMDRRIIESDVRMRVDSLFREAGIVVAFPQRDVHLDSVAPITVNLVREDDRPAAGSSDASGV